MSPFRTGTEQRTAVSLNSSDNLLRLHLVEPVAFRGKAEPESIPTLLALFPETIPLCTRFERGTKNCPKVTSWSAFPTNRPSPLTAKSLQLFRDHRRCSEKRTFRSLLHTRNTGCDLPYIRLRLGFTQNASGSVPQRRSTERDIPSTGAPPWRKVK